MHALANFRRPPHCRPLLLAFGLGLTLLAWLQMGTIQSELSQPIETTSSERSPYTSNEVPVKKARVLVTGASSLLGWEITKRLVESSARVVAVDELNDADRLKRLNIDVVESDLALQSPQSVARFFRDHGPFERVIHVARDDNGTLGLGLLREASQTAGNYTQFLLISTAEVYGDQQRVLTEKILAAPLTAASTARAALEMAVRGSGLPYVIFRTHDLYTFDWPQSDTGKEEVRADDVLKGFEHFLVPTSAIAKQPWVQPSNAAEVAQSVLAVSRVPAALGTTLNVGGEEVFRADHLRDVLESRGLLTPEKSPLRFVSHDAIARLLPLASKPSKVSDAFERLEKRRLDRLSRGYNDLYNLPRGAPRIFYFGITHNTTSHKAAIAEATWGHRVMPSLPWYSTSMDSRLKNCTVLRAKEGDSYNYVYQRMLLVWKHVWENYPGFDWYVRAWDDNFLFHERYAEVASQFDPKSLVEIGRVGTYEREDLYFGDDSPHKNGTKTVSFIGGGAASLASGALVEKFVNNIASCPKEMYGQEDVTISDCRAKLGAKFKAVYGFHAQAPRPGVLNLVMSDLSCRRKFLEYPQHQPALPVNFHYVKAENMPSIDRAWYSTPCSEAESRAKEVNAAGPGLYGVIVN